MKLFNKSNDNNGIIENFVQVFNGIHGIFLNIFGCHSYCCA